MFDFEKLIAYQKALSIYKDIYRLLKQNKLERNTRDQLHRASLSMVVPLPHLHTNSKLKVTYQLPQSLTLLSTCTHPVYFYRTVLVIY